MIIRVVIAFSPFAEVRALSAGMATANGVQAPSVRDNAECMARYAHGARVAPFPVGGVVPAAPTIHLTTGNSLYITLSYLYCIRIYCTSLLCILLNSTLY